MSFNNRYVLISVTMALLLLASGCNSSTVTKSSEEPTEANAGVSDTVETSKISDVFTDRDKDSSYDESKAIGVSLSDNKISCTSDKVKIAKNTVTITDEGTYIFNGTLSNGMIVVDAEKTDKLQIVLNGVNVNCNTSAPLYVKQADKVFVTLADKTENTLSNKNEFVAIDDNNIDSVIFSKDDITFNGKGKLIVNANYGHGIVSKDDLVFTGGEYNITSQNHALTGNDSIKLANSLLTIKSGKDGLHAENTEDTTKGIVYIESGTIKLTSDGDGVDASGTVNIADGTIDITSGGGSENAEKKQEEMFGRGGFAPNTSTTDTEKTSSKGIKSSADMTIANGTLNINSADDSMHSNNSLTISGGKLTLSSGDDGIHADANAVITNGTINITDSYEGIEGHTIEMSGGNVTLVASDDGLNSAGGNDESGFGGGMRMDEFATDDDSYIKISGGTLRIDAQGDGIDSNGALYISGGETYVMGPSNGGNGTLDYASIAEITGGMFVGVGDSGMTVNFTDASNQGVMLVNTSTSNINGDVILKDSKNKEIVSYTPSRSYNSVIISCAEIKEGETYTLTANGTDTTVEMTSLIYGESNGMGGFGGMPMGEMEPPNGMMR